MTAYFKIIVFTLACFIAGAVFWPDFLELSINEIKTSRMILNTRGDIPFENGQILFVFTIGLIPILHFAVIRLAGIRSFKQKIISLAIIIFSGIALWQGKLLSVILKTYRTVDNLKPTGTELPFDYSINELQPHLYLAIGVLMGTILSAVIFRKINLKGKSSQTFKPPSPTPSSILSLYEKPNLTHYFLLNS